MSHFLIAVDLVLQIICIKSMLQSNGQSFFPKARIKTGKDIIISTSIICLRLWPHAK